MRRRTRLKIQHEETFSKVNIKKSWLSLTIFPCLLSKIHDVRKQTKVIISPWYVGVEASVKKLAQHSRVVIFFPQDTRCPPSIVFDKESRLLSNTLLELKININATYTVENCQKNNPLIAYFLTSIVLDVNMKKNHRSQ